MTASHGRILVGIGGWSFAPWRGSFYPHKLAQARELEHASRQVTSIEINATFYGSQKPASFAKWRDAVPEGFVFSVKAPRVATNRRNLAESVPSIERFVASGIAELGDRLGPLLWQFPASRKFEPEVMDGFLHSLPRTVQGITLRHVVETQHESFRDPAYMALLQRHGVAHAVVDSDKHPLLGDQTAGFSYARLQRNQASSREGYDGAALDLWASRARSWWSGNATDLPLAAPALTTAPGAPGARSCHVYFISGDKVRAPDSARALLARLADTAPPG